MGAAHPWHLDNETESILFLTDMGDKPVRIGIHAQANGVHYFLTKLKLNAHETRAINLRSLRNSQKPDFRGNRMPAEATDGTLAWTRIDDVPVMGRLVVMERKARVATNYDCNLCACPDNYVGLEVMPSPSYVVLNGTVQLSACAQFQVQCSTYKYYCPVSSGVTWTSSTPSIATVNSSGVVTGVSVGSTGVTAKWGGGFTYTWSSTLQACVQHSATHQGSSTVNVVCPVPNNFAQSGSAAFGDGRLQFTYTWGSTSGKLADLSKCSCEVGEEVDYPGYPPTAGTYFWPIPPWSASSTNPTIDITQSATVVPLTHIHHPGAMVAPSRTASFAATQYYQYKCTGVNSGNAVTLDGPISIARSVTKNTDGSFKYTITKSGASATCTVGVNCTQ